MAAWLQVQASSAQVTGMPSICSIRRCVKIPQQPARVLQCRGLHLPPRNAQPYVGGGGAHRSITVCGIRRKSSSRGGAHLPGNRDSGSDKDADRSSRRQRDISAGAASADATLDHYGGNKDVGGHGGGGGGGGGGGDNGGGEGFGDDVQKTGGFDPLGLGAGWKQRVSADPQFGFKVFTEQVIGVGASVIGDMSARPHWGIYELDFVLSTIIVGSIVNFSLMYMLAPTSSDPSTATQLPGIFASCPAGHMFENGQFNALERLGTFVYKGVQFSAVGFFAGLVGTTVTNTLVNVRKSMDPNFVANKPPPTVLNAATWALHMGLSANTRYQVLNLVEFLLVPRLPPPVFQGLVIAMRSLNNAVGGISFAALARITGSQKSVEAEPKVA